MPHHIDQIFITGIKVQASVGVYESEKQRPQPLIIDLKLYRSIELAALSDDVTQCIDYTIVEKNVHDFFNQHFELIETIAHHLALHLIKQHQLAGIEVRVHKQAGLVNATDVGVCITRWAS